jgi:hypothetical protein
MCRRVWALALGMWLWSPPVAASVGCQGRFWLLRPLPDRCLGPIDTDRPHLTESPGLVPPGHLQVEMGVTALELRSRRDRRMVFFENLYKIGIVDGLDLELLVVHVEADARRFALEPSRPLVARAKIALEHTPGMETTLVPIVAIPLDEDDTAEAGAQLFAWWQLPWDIDLELNTGLQVPLQRRFAPAFIVGSALTGPVAGPVRAFGELYAVHEVVTRPQLTLGTGLMIAVDRDIQIDTGLFVGLLGDTVPLVPFVGVALRR